MSGNAIDSIHTVPIQFVIPTKIVKGKYLVLIIIVIEHTVNTEEKK